MGCASAKQLSSVPGDEEDLDKAHSNGDAFSSDEYKMKGVEKVKCVHGEEERMNTRNQEHLVTHTYTHTPEVDYFPISTGAFVSFHHISFLFAYDESPPTTSPNPFLASLSDHVTVSRFLVCVCVCFYRRKAHFCTRANTKRWAGTLIKSASTRPRASRSSSGCWMRRSKRDATTVRRRKT